MREAIKEVIELELEQHGISNPELAETITRAVAIELKIQSWDLLIAMTGHQDHLPGLLGGPLL